MNKKYLILKKRVPKAGNGDRFAPKPMPTFGVNSIAGIDDRGLTPMQGAELSNGTATPGASEITSNILGMVPPNKKETKNSNLLSGIDAGVGALTNLAGSVGSQMIAKNAADREVVSGFGDVQSDRKAIKGADALSTAVTGGDMGSQIGNFIPIPGGGLIGRGVGMAIGAGVGLLTGNKKADEAEAKDKELLARNMLLKNKSDDRMLSQQLLTGKQGAKLKKKNLGAFKLQKKKSTSLIMKTGGKLETPGEVNVVVKGKMHRENNNLGNKDKGVPVVDAQGNKEYEVEKGEIILRHDITILAEKYAAEYKATGNDDLLTELGEVISEELLKNTQDNDGKFGVKVKEDED